ncbi:MAG TPA: hypothetical protein ENL38_01755 [Candidatus Aminicenantes bacterium]|nr:hypothetical protein [Candidatus Aminicenantes bacterium]
MQARFFSRDTIEVFEINQFGNPCRIRSYGLPENFEIPNLRIKGLGIKKELGDHPVADIYITREIVKSLVTLGIAPREHFYWRRGTPIAVRSE